MTDHHTEVVDRGVSGGHGPGRHRQRARWAISGVLALAVALTAAAVLLWLPPESPETPAATGPVPLSSAWPAAAVGSLPSAVPDGPGFDPLYLLDARTAIGTAPTPDGKRLRLLLRAGDDPPRQLRSLPTAAEPIFSGVTAAGDDLVWAESTARSNGTTVHRMWTVDRRSGGRPRMLTADTGAVAFFNSQHDMVIADGRLHWVAVAPQEKPLTEIRSVPLTGGKVTVRVEPGPWALSAWPWLVSAATTPSVQAQLRNLAEGTQRTVPAAPSELVTCSPQWCRAQVVAGDGPTRLDLMRPDGSDRRQIGGPAEQSPVMDVAVLDRFELLARAGSEGSPTSDRELLLYDLSRRSTVVVGTGVGTVVSRAGLLWWSTGDVDNLKWHTLDLRTLT